MGKSVLVIDSGVGGLTTLAAIRKKLEHIDVIYFADDNFLPYGDKSENELAFHICDIISLFESQICAVVLACNTATGVSVELARKLFCLPIIGTEPAVLPACRGNGRVAVLVTPLEAKQPKFKRLVGGKDVVVFEMKTLAKTIDDCLVEGEGVGALLKSNELLEQIDALKSGLCKKNIDSVVLGCTHYVFLKFTDLLLDFDLFDGNEGVAKRLCSFVENRGSGETKILFGSGNNKKSQIALRLLNELLDFGF